MSWNWTTALPTIFKEYTTTERDALGDPPENVVIFNTTTDQHETFFESVWSPIVIGDTASVDTELVRWNGTGGNTIESPNTTASSTTATLGDGGDLTIYSAAVDGNPTFRFGSSSSEALWLTMQYVTGTQTLESVSFVTFTASGTDDHGEYKFSVDATAIFTIDDGGIEVFGSLMMKEQAEANTDIASYGQLWIDTATPNRLFFTNDSGKDVRLGTKHAAIIVSAPDGDVITTGDGKAAFRLDSSFDNMDLIEVGMSVTTVSTSGLPKVQLRRSRKNLVTSRTIVDILSTELTIDQDEFDSNDATTAAVINSSNEDMSEDDVILVDIDTAGTGTKGLCITLVFAAEA